MSQRFWRYDYGTRRRKIYICGLCEINIDPDSETLAEIAYQSSKTAEMVGLDPKIAMLSFSTKGSAKGPMVNLWFKMQQI